MTNTEQTLREALEQIVAIENQYFGSDWVEIEKARNIARAALATQQAPALTDEQARVRVAFMKGWDHRGMHEGLRGSFENDEAMRYYMNAYYPRTAQAPAPALTDEQIREKGKDWCDNDGHELPGEGAAAYLAGFNRARALLAAASPTPTEDALDAKRYRWLRAQVHDDFRFSVVKNPHFDIFESPEELDAAIDAAIASTQTKEAE